MAKTRICSAVVLVAACFSVGVFGAQRPADNPAGAVAGVIYKFYNNVTTGGSLPTFTSLSPTSTGVINNFLFTPAGGQSTNMGFVYTGFISIPTAGVWTFYTNSDDGSAFYIGKPGVDEVKVNPGNEGAHGPQEVSGTIDLAAGLHQFKVEFAQGGGGYQLICSMAGPGVAKTAIPDSSLSYIQLTPTPVITPADPKIPTPTFQVTITSVPGATVYYTTNNTNPTTASTVYSNPITLAPPVTVKAMAKLPNYDFSLIASTSFISAQPPANNNFANATLLSGNLPITSNGNNNNATWEANEPNHGDGNGQKSIWYKWVAPSATSIVVSTLGSAIDTTLAVYTSPAPPAIATLVKIAENDDATGDSAIASTTTTSLVAFQAVAGTTYYIAVDGFNGAEGNTTVSVSTGPVLSVAATSPNASESGPVSGSFTVTRTGNTGVSFTATVEFGGTADRGADYRRIVDTVTFSAGTPSASITITPIDDLIYEGQETATVTLLPSPYYSLDPLPSKQTATVNIFDNEAVATGKVKDTSFSVKRGFYSAPISVAITTETVGASIRYTTDGSAPTPFVGTLYVNPLNISTTTVLRAIAYKTGMNPTNVDTQTYIFTADVILQQPQGQVPPGWPPTSMPTGQIINYGMDPNIVTPNAAHIQNDLKSLPSFCISIKLADMFDSSTGFYANPTGDGFAWERPCNLELLYPNDVTANWGELCGIRLRGGFSRSAQNPKHAFRFFFRNDYNKNSLDQPVFGPSPAQQEIDTFDLRTGQNYSWSFQGDRNNYCFMRDVFCRDAQVAMSGFGCRGDYFNLYVNGLYFGLFNTDERGEASWAANYFGGQKEDYDVIKSASDGPNGYSIYATDGTFDAWTRLWKACKAGLSTNAAYFKIQGRNPDGTLNPSFENLVEMDELIDYMLVTYYGGNLDAPISNFLGNTSPNNWFGSRNRNGNQGFRFTQHDGEHTLLDINQNRVGPWPAGDSLDKSNPQWVLQQCWTNAEFKIKIADKIRKHMLQPGGALTPAACTARFNTRKNQLSPAIYCESARWGDSKTSPACTWNDWNNCCNNIINNYFPGRTNIVVQQLSAVGLYPTLSAPNFSQYGGNITPGFVCTITNPQSGTSRIYYTTDGSDPRLIGGAINSTATMIATTSGPVTLNGTITLRARIFNSPTNTWSAMTESTFVAPQDFTKLKVTEIMYNPLGGSGGVDGDEFEFFEMKNTGTVPLNLSGAQFVAGFTYTFPSGSVINPGNFVVLVSNPSQFGSRYPGVTPYGTYTGRLSNNSDTVTLNYSTGTPIFTFHFNDAAPWPVAADGLGFSIVPKDPASNFAFGDYKSWRASTNVGGSPGADDPVNTLGDIKINECLTHAEPLPEYIELYNAGNSPVDISGWYLTDDRHVPQKYRIPNNTPALQPGAYFVVSATLYDPTPGVGTSFGLDSHGEGVFVFSSTQASTAITGYSHGFTFGAQQNGVSFGRHVISTGDEHFVRQVSQTPNAVNSGPATGPIVFNEIMYQPAVNGDEYIEYLNISNAAVQLFDPNVPANTWKIAGLDYTFPPGITIAPNSLFLVVGIDPTTFRTKYNVPAAIPIYGPWLGVLQDNGETLELQKPDNPDPIPGGGTFVPYVAVDTVDYTNAAPWPFEPAGSGPSLQRKVPASYGNDPANWQKSPTNGGTPGTSESLVPPTPANFAALAASPTSINLSWNDVNGENSYTIQRSPNGTDTWFSLPAIGANITSTVSSGLAGNTTYYYRIFASNGFGDSPFSAVVNATTPPLPAPVAPAILVATTASQSKIVLNWQDPNDNESDTRIERSPDGVGNWQEVGQVLTDVHTYLDQNLSASTIYFYRVRAHNATGFSAYSNISSDTTFAPRIVGGTVQATIIGGHQASVFVNLNSAGAERSVAFSLNFDSLLFSNPTVIKDPSLGNEVTLTTASSASGVGVTLARTDATNFGTGIKPLVEIRLTAANVATASNSSFTFGDTPTARVTLNELAQPLETTYTSIPVSITPNTAPVAQAGLLPDVLEDIPKDGTLIATDANNDTLTYSVVAQGTKGTVTVTNATTGAYTYTPNLYTFGQDSFTFRANDGVVNSNTATVSVTITHVNHAPEAQNGTLSTDEGVSKSGTLSAIEHDTADTLTYSVVAQGAKGFVTIDNPQTGAYTYAPNPGGRGLDTFTFKANDNAVDSNTATITVTINYNNSNPVAQDGLLAVNEDEPKSGTLAATDNENDPLTYSVVTQPAKGIVTITNASTGAYTYTPNPLTSGSDSFTFKASDGLLESLPATISVTISHVNHVPTVTNKSVTTSDSAQVSGTLTATDLDNDPLTFRIGTNGTKGTAVVVAATGAFTYTPNGTATGIDTFTFIAKDASADSLPGTVTVTINPTGVAITSPAVASGNVRENFQFSIVTTGTQPIQIDATGLPPGLTLTGGAIAGTPTAAGKYPVIVTATNAGGSQTQLLLITIVNTGGTANNPPIITSGPTASKNPAVVGEAITFNAVATDANNDLLEYTWTMGDGTTETGATFSHAYTAPGTYVVTLTVSDGAVSDVGTLLLAVNPAGTPTLNPLTVKKMQVALKFTSVVSDSVTLSGLLPVELGKPSVGTNVTVFIGGKATPFTLDSKGRAGKSTPTFKVAVKKGLFSTSLASFTFVLKKTNLQDTLQPFGLVNATITAPVIVPVGVTVGGISYTSDVPMLYKGKAFKTGAAKK